MHTQIRLAERQGLLRGHGMSPVQAKASFLLEQIDTYSSIKDSDKRLREAMLATGNWDFERLFPELLQKEATSAAEIDEALASDDGSVSYDFSEAEFDPAQAEALLASLIGSASSGTVSAAELDEGWV